MADLTQSSATTATTTPQYYTDYISNLARAGTQYGVGGTNAPEYVQATPNQNAAFTKVATNAGNYMGDLTGAGSLLTQGGNVDITGAANPYLKAAGTSGLTAADPYLTSGTTGADSLVSNYMNPYVKSVVDQIRLANQQNIAQNLSPGITAGAVGSGQFGSQRGANALALGISNANIGALGQQSTALQAGYSDALKAAMQQRANQLTAGQTAATAQNAYNANQIQAGQIAGNMSTQQAQNLRDLAAARMNLGQQTQTQGLADVNALATLGAQQQKIAQDAQLFPLDVLGKQAGVLSGANIPTTQTATMTGSPLSAIAGLGALGTGMFTKNSGGTSPASNFTDWLKSMAALSTVSPPGYVPPEGTTGFVGPSQFETDYGRLFSDYYTPAREDAP